jgi:hypothetical protein
MPVEGRGRDPELGRQPPQRQRLQPGPGQQVDGDRTTFSWVRATAVASFRGMSGWVMNSSLTVVE